MVKKNYQLLPLWIIVISILFITAITAMPATVTILSPTNTTLNNLTIALNWTFTGELDWAGYSINGTSNNTAIYPLVSTLNDSNSTNLTYSNFSSNTVYITIPKTANVTIAKLNISGFPLRNNFANTVGVSSKEATSSGSFDFNITTPSNELSGGTKNINISFGGNYNGSIQTKTISATKACGTSSSFSGGFPVSWWFQVEDCAIVRSPNISSGSTCASALTIYWNKSDITTNCIPSSSTTKDFIARDVGTSQTSDHAPAEWGGISYAPPPSDREQVINSTSFSERSWTYSDPTTTPYEGDASWTLEWGYFLKDFNITGCDGTSWVDTQLGYFNTVQYEWDTNITTTNKTYTSTNCILTLNTTSGGKLLYNYSLRYELRNFTSNVTIDTGNDGKTDFTFLTELNLTTLPQEVNLNTTAINEFLASCTAVNGNCDVPIKITGNAGVIQVSSIKVNYPQNLTFNVSEGQNNIIIYVNETDGTSNLSQIFFTNDISSPTFSNIIPQSDTELFVSLTKVYTFKVDVSDTASNIDTVKFQFDSTNYTANLSSGNTYNASLSGIATGVHTFKWFANDTQGFEDNTSQFTWSLVGSTGGAGGGGGGGGIVQCGNNVCEFPETSETCPADCKIQNFSLTSRQQILPGFPGGTAVCFGLVDRCNIGLLNKGVQILTIAVEIRQFQTDQSWTWASLLDGNEKKDRLTLEVGPISTNFIDYVTVIPESVSFGEYRYDIVFTSGTQQVIFPVVIQVSSQASFNVIFTQIVNSLTTFMNLPIFPLPGNIFGFEAIVLWHIIVIISIILLLLFARR